MQIRCIKGVGYDSNVYLLLGENPSIVDTGTGLHAEYVLEKISEYIEPTKIRQIVLTHEHFDHCGGTIKLLDLTGKNTKIMSHENSVSELSNGKSSFALLLGGKMPRIHIDVPLHDEDMIILGSDKFQVLHTPGHSCGSICLFNDKNKTLISGDTIFSDGGFGRYDLPGGNVQLLLKSIERLSGLDVKNLYPGHGSWVINEGKKHVLMSLENIHFMV